MAGGGGAGDSFGGLGGSLAVLVVLVSAFVASGLPMLWDSAAAMGCGR